MASRRLVPASVRDDLLGIPSDIGSLERNYVLADEDLDLVATRRRPENRLGLAVHIVLLRHPGQGWLDGLEPPTPLVAWLAEQVDVSSEALARYAARGPTRSEHRRVAIRHLGLRVFLRAEHMRAAILLAARCCFPLYLVRAPHELTGLFRRRISWDDGAIRDTSGRGEVAFLMTDGCRSGADAVARAALGPRSQAPA